MSPGVAASIKARLLNQARECGEEFERTLMRFAAERLLFRLGAPQREIDASLREPASSLCGCRIPAEQRATSTQLASGPTDDAAIRSLHDIGLRIWTSK